MNKESCSGEEPQRSQRGFWVFELCDLHILLQTETKRDENETKEKTWEEDTEGKNRKT